MTFTPAMIRPPAAPSERDHDLAVYIGRFQPFHRGHAQVLKRALQEADRVLILVGSANLARDTRNSWTFSERLKIIWGVVDDLVEEYAAGVRLTMGEHQALAQEIKSRIAIEPLDDSPYRRSSWIDRVSMSARHATTALRPRIALIGNIRDQTSEYLGWFPAWTYIACNDSNINATTIRKAYFAGNVNFDQASWEDGLQWNEVLYPSTIAALHQFRETATYPYLMKQKAAEEAYRVRWGHGPHQTVDPVIVKGDHVLMIRRGGLEGTDSEGLPGGFLNAYERLIHGAAREGIEETALFVPAHQHRAMREYLAESAKDPGIPMPQFMLDAQKLLLSYQRGHGMRFDDPHRSRRGHLITEAALFVLPDGHGLPEVHGMSDAQEAFWKPISEVRPDNSFEDHAFIIDKMLDQR